MRVFYAEAIYGDEEIDAVIDVLKNSPHALMAGERVRTFEARVAVIFGKKSALMVNSGSSANLLAISAAGIPKGAEVITPALTFSTTVAPLVQCGLIPSFVDVEPASFIIDIDQIEGMITSATKAMMIPNLIGNLPDWDRLRGICDQHGLLLIEDSADTIGYRYKGGNTGQLSDITTSSFYASHVITAAGFGGVVCINDETISERATVLRSWGRSSSRMGESEDIDSRFNNEVDDVEYDSKFVFESLGFNFIPSEISAAFGLVQLDRLKDYIAKRQENFGQLRSLFQNFDHWFKLPEVSRDAETAMLALPLIVKPDAPFNRQQLQIFFEERDIQTRTVFSGNILRQPGFKDIDRRESKAGYPNADQVMSGGMLIGCHHGMGQAEIEYVSTVFEEFIRSY